jgi:soluble lytic murein transglycosylase
VSHPLRTTASILPVALLGVALTVVSCGATLWNRPADAWKDELASGNTAPLLALGTKDLAESDLGPLGDGAAWALGTVFSDADKAAEAEILWKRSFANDGSPWREASGRRLFELYADRRDWPKAEAVAKKLVGLWSGPDLQRLLFQAYYFQKKDDQAWDLLKGWKPGAFPPDQELENQLFFGVLSARAGRTDDAAKALKTLVFDTEASVLHFRLESFFQEDESRYDLLGPGGREAVAFQSLVYKAVPKDIQTWFKGRQFPAGFWNHRALVAGVTAAFKAEGRAETGLRLLGVVEPGLTGEARFEAEFGRARLYRALGWWPQARASFQKAQALATTPQDKKMTAWNWLNAWVQTSSSGALAPFVQVYASTDDPGYFSDVLEDWLNGLIQDRRWDLLAAVVRDLGPRLPASDRATAGFILARLSAHHLVDLGREGVTETPQALLEATLASQPYSYEALVARAVLGRPLDWADPQEPAFQADDRSRDLAKRWDAMARLGLAKAMANEVVASEGPLDPEFVQRTAVFLEAHGQYRPALQILYRLLKDPGRGLTKDRALLLFPTAFEATAVEKAQAEGLEPSLLLGLMREESSFDAGAKSWVGAQGLTQLMPSTAAETAKRLKLKTYDLADPTDNITLGARYLATMVQSQGRIYLALMAYNAGGGRIKPWKQSMGKLPEEIFVEAAPFEETRGYVKKILTSTVMIGVLHYGKTLDEMVRVIYPGFQP